MDESLDFQNVWRESLTFKSQWSVLNSAGHFFV
jgi:hypothetical protein